MGVTCRADRRAKFIDSNLPDVPAVGANLADLRDALSDPACGIPNADDCLLVRSPASPAMLAGCLRAAANEATDLLIVYYVGRSAGRSCPRGSPGSARASRRSSTT